MRCTVTGERYTVFGYGGKQVRDNIHSADLVRAFAAFHASPRAAAVYNIGGGRESNCSMLEAIDALRARSPAASSTGRSATEARIGDHRWWISDLARVPGATTRLGARRTASRRSCARSTSRTSSAGAAARVKLSVVIPAHNEAGSIGDDGRRRSPTRLEAQGSTTRSWSSTTRAPTARAAVVARAAGDEPARPLPPLALPARLRLRGPRRAGRVHGRRRRDRHGRRLGRARATSSRYYRVLEEGYDCAFGSRFVRGADGHRLPAAQARPQPPRQLGHPRALPPRLQRHDQRVQGLPARGHRDGPAAALESLQPDRRDAVEGDRPRPQLRGRADLLDEPHAGRRRS